MEILEQSLEIVEWSFVFLPFTFNNTMLRFFKAKIKENSLFDGECSFSSYCLLISLSISYIRLFKCFLSFPLKFHLNLTIDWFTYANSSLDKFAYIPKINYLSTTRYRFLKKKSIDSKYCRLWLRFLFFVLESIINDYRINICINSIYIDEVIWKQFRQRYCLMNFKYGIMGMKQKVSRNITCSESFLCSRSLTEQCVCSTNPSRCFNAQQYITNWTWA